MTDQHFAIFDTAIGRCGIAWGSRGINAVQLPMSNEDKTRARIRQRHGDIAEAPPPAEVQSAIDGIVELLAGKPNDLSDVVLDPGIRLAKPHIHFHLDDALFVGRQVRGYVFERHKGGRRHEELAEDQG